MDKNERNNLFQIEQKKQIEFSDKCDADFPELMLGCFDNSCPSGWQQDVYECLTELNKYVEEGVRVDQIKEKFAELRLYISCSEAIDVEQADIHKGCYNLILDCEKKVNKKCQFTGKPAEKIIVNGVLWNVCKDIMVILNK